MLEYVVWLYYGYILEIHGYITVTCWKYLLTFQIRLQKVLEYCTTSQTITQSSVSYINSPTPKPFYY